MPLPQGTRFRFKKGTKLRLAFTPGSDQVIETKNMMSGATHSASEFSADRAKKKKKSSLRQSMLHGS